MHKKVVTSMRLIMLWAMMLLIGLPVGSILSAGHAQAAAPAKTVTATVTPEAATSKPVAKKLNFIGSPTGLVKANAYVTGQAIKLQVKITDAPQSVWAETGLLDPTFPATTSLRQLSNGSWALETPKLTANLKPGAKVLKIIATNNQEKAETTVKLNLQVFQAAKALQLKEVSEKTVSINWQPVSFADRYLVSWANGHGTKTLNTGVTSATLENLTAGTTYTVSVKPLRQEAVGPALSTQFKTLGLAPVATPTPAVETSQAPVAITPQITPKAAQTQAPAGRITSTPTPKVEGAATPTPTPSVTSTASPAPEDKGTTGNWNKLLIALSILVIAAGAAIGGYYGYEWLMIRSKDKEPPTTRSRW